MRIKIRNLIAAFSLLFSISFAVASVAPVHAQLKNELCSGASLNLNGNAGDCDADGTKKQEDKLNTLIKTVVNVISVIIGIVAVIMIIFGGFRYITSGGDTAGVTAAKNTIIYALVGLIIVALAQVIVKFVLGKV